MLPDALRLLISAYAAGELSPDRSEAARRLLKHSAEARALLLEVQSDARALQQLPQRAAPPELADAVIRRLPDNWIFVRPISVQAARWPAVATISVAGTVLMSVCAGVWILLSLPQSSTPNNQPVTRTGPPTTDLALTKKSDPTPRPIVEQPSEVTAPIRVAAAPPPVEMPSLPSPEKPPVTGTELASPSVPLPEPIQIALPRLPEVYTAHALDQTAVKASLAQEFGKGETHRIDLFCKDGGRTVERLQLALKERGVRVVVDATVAELQKRKYKGSYAIYCDDLTTAEWSSLLQSLGRNDRKAEEKKPGEGLLEQLVLMPLTSSDQKDLHGLMGADPTPPARSKGPDARRPISDDTADQVAKSLGKADAAKAQKQALVVPYGLPRLSPATSKEIRQFMESGHDRRPECIAVLLIVRLPL
jgi:hypothetical protein